MAKTHVPKIRHPLSEDEAGVVYSARDAAGNRLNLRKPKADGPEGKSLNPEEEEAYQGAVSKLSAIHHPSLFQVVSGHTDPEDELPFLTIKPVDGEILSEIDESISHRWPLPWSILSYNSPWRSGR